MARKKPCTNSVRKIERAARSSRISSSPFGARHAA
jgi:hypothetical protein